MLAKVTTTVVDPRGIVIPLDFDPSVETLDECLLRHGQYIQISKVSIEKLRKLYPGRVA